MNNHTTNWLSKTADQLALYTVRLRIWGTEGKNPQSQSGVIIGNGQILTAAHGIPDQRHRIEVWFLDEAAGTQRCSETVSVHLVVCEGGVDLAVLECPDLPQRTHLQKRNAVSSSSAAYPVVIAGYPLGLSTAKAKDVSLRTLRGTFTPSEGVGSRSARTDAEPGCVVLDEKYKVEVTERIKKPEEQGLKGVSGAGVFLDVPGQPQLLGIVVDQPADGFGNHITFTRFGPNLKEHQLGEVIDLRDTKKLEDTHKLKYPAGLCHIQPVADFKENPALAELERVALREDQLGRVEPVGGTYVLHGLAGSGKTQVAAKFAQRCAERGWFVLSANGDSILKLKSGYVAAERLFHSDTAETTALDDETAANAMRSRIASSDEPVVVLIDNVNQPPSEYPEPARPEQGLPYWLPAGNNITYVITSRAATMPLGVCTTNAVAVMGLTEEAALDVLKPHIAEGNIKTAKQVCEAFEYMPLPLFQAEAYMRKCGYSLAEYKTKLHEMSAGRKPFRKGETHGYPDLAIEAIKLNRKQFFASEPNNWAEPDVSYERLATLWAVADAQGLSIAHVASSLGIDRDHSSDFVAAAQDSNILSHSAANSTEHISAAVTMHRWMATVLRDVSERPTLEKAVTDLVTLCNTVVDQYDSKNNTDTKNNGWSLEKQSLAQIVGAQLASAGFAAQLLSDASENSDLLPELTDRTFTLARWVANSHLVSATVNAWQGSVAVRTITCGWDHPDTLTAQNNLACALESSGAVGEAITMYREVLAASERVLGQDHPDTLTTRSNLASALRASGAVGEAITMFQEVLSSHERVLGEDHPDTLSTRNNLAGALRESGAVGEAITMYREVLVARERVLGADHPDTLSTRSNLAYALRESGAVGEAITMYREVLSSHERVLGADHLHTLSTRSNLAYALRESGAVGEAITMYREVLSSHERVLGADHLHTLSTRSNLASALRESGAVGEAITMYREVLVAQERVLGGDHPATLASRNDLAHALHTTGAIGDAITMYQEVLACQQRVLGEDHPDTLTTRNNLASALHTTGAIGDAITMYQEVLACQQRVLGEDHPDTLTTRNNLASALHTTGAVGEAITMYQEVLACQQRVLGEDHPDTLTTWNNVAYALQSSGSVREAIAAYLEVLVTRERVLGADHPDTLTTRHSLAGALRESGAVEDAIVLYQEVLSAEVRVFGEDHPDTLTTRNNLAQALESSGTMVEAVPMYREVLAARERVLGADHPDTLTTQLILGVCLITNGEDSEGRKLLEDGLNTARRILGDDHPHTRTISEFLGQQE